MAKINSTYSSGYYISPDTDFRRLEEQQQAEKKKLFKRSRDGGEDDPDVLKANTKRQTFAIPFDLYCDHCERRIARGAHVYTNRRPTKMKYLNVIRVWELEIRCQYCSGLYRLQTDPETPKETGGYKCVRGCHRAEGDFLALNTKNAEEKAKWEKEQAEAEANPLAALERENELSRQLAERNRQIEEDVLSRTDGDDDAENLLFALRRRRLLSQATANGDGTASTTNTAALSGGLSASKYTFDSYGEDGEESDGLAQLKEEEIAAEEAAYQQFEADMQTRWMLLHQQQQQQASSSSASSSLPAGIASAASGWFAPHSTGTGEKSNVDKDDGDDEPLDERTERAGTKEGSGDNALAVALARYGGNNNNNNSNRKSSGNAFSTSFSSSPTSSATGTTRTKQRTNAFAVRNDSGSDDDDSLDEVGGEDSKGPHGGLSVRKAASDATTAPTPSKTTKKSSLLSSMLNDDDDD